MSSVLVPHSGPLARRQGWVFWGTGHSKRDLCRLPPHCKETTKQKVNVIPGIQGIAANKIKKKLWISLILSLFPRLFLPAVLYYGAVCTFTHYPPISLSVCRRLAHLTLGKPGIWGIFAHSYAPYYPSTKY